MTYEDQLARDLRRHFGNRLHKLLVDSSHTCEVAEVSTSDIIGIHLSAMMQATVLAVLEMDMGEEDFLRLCKLCYRSIEQQQRECED